MFSQPIAVLPCEDLIFISVLPLCLHCLGLGEPGHHQGKLGITMAKSLIPIGPGSSWWSPFEAPVCAGIALCHPGYPQSMPDHSGLSLLNPGSITVCPGIAPVFDTCPGLHRRYPGCIKHFNTTGTVYLGSSRSATDVYSSATVLSKFLTVDIPVHPNSSNQGEPGR